jgi:hypothetical protein
MDIGKLFGGSAGTTGAIVGKALGGDIGGGLLGGLGAGQDARYQHGADKYWFGRQSEFENEMFERQKQHQIDFAKQSLSWKIDQAKQHGISPLAAMGASMTAGSPISVGTPSPPGIAAGMGQDISRAVAATATKQQKEAAQLTLEKASLENDLLRTQVASEKAKLINQTGPGMPGVEMVTNKRSISPSGDKLHQQSGDIPYTGFARSASGGLVPVPSTDAKERIEDQFMPEMKWSFDNYLKPLFTEEAKPSPKLLTDKQRKKGYVDWEYSPLAGEYVPVKKKGRTPLKRMSEWWKRLRAPSKKKSKQPWE